MGWKRGNVGMMDGEAWRNEVVRGNGKAEIRGGK